MSKFSKIRLALVILAIVIFLLAFLSPVSYTASDPTFSLLTSQAIVEHGSVKLDDYWAGLRPAPTLPDNDGRLRTINDHTYYYFPVGTSLVAVPFVWVANWFNLDMSNVEEDAWLQNLISALICAALFLNNLPHCYLLSSSAGKRSAFRDLRPGHGLDQHNRHRSMESRF